MLSAVFRLPEGLLVKRQVALRLRIIGSFTVIGQTHVKTYNVLNVLPRLVQKLQFPIRNIKENVGNNNRLIPEMVLIVVSFLTFHRPYKSLLNATCSCYCEFSKNLPVSLY